MILFQLKNGKNPKNGIKYLSESRGVKQRDTYLEEVDLTEGEYMLYVEMEWAEEGETERTFCATCYGFSKVQWN